MNNINLYTKIAGVDLSKCTMNAAGVLCTSKNDLDKMRFSNSGAMVSKSSTYKKRIGNEKPRLYIDNFGTINSTGLANEGYTFYTDYSKNVIEKPFIQSISPFSIEEMIEMLQHIENQVQNKILVEINPSCPNIKGKSIVAYDYNTFENWLSVMNNLNLNKVKIGLKLPPYYDNNDFDIVSELIKKYKVVQFITCVNSIPNGLFINVEKETTCIKPNNGLGGVGGEYIKPISLANVYQFNKRIGDCIDIIGCGGVSTGSDVFKHILAGAKACSIGSALLKESEKIFDRIHNELETIMKSKNYTNIEQFRGKLKVIS